MGGQLDAFHNLSNDLVKAAIVMRFDDYGWCRGVIEYRNQDRRRKFQGRLVNFVAQFDIDEGITDLTLERGGGLRHLTGRAGGCMVPAGACGG